MPKRAMLIGLAMVLGWVVIALYAGSPAGAAAPAPTVLRAQRFVVVTPSGKEAAEFGYKDGAVRLRIPAAIGEAGVVVGRYAKEGWCGLALFDAAGKPRIEVQQTQKGGPAINLYDAEHRLRFQVSMGATPSEVAINVLDGSGKLQLACGADAAGRPSIALLGQDGISTRVVLYVDRDETGHLVLKDGTGRVRFEVPSGASRSTENKTSP